MMLVPPFKYGLLHISCTLFTLEFAATEAEQNVLCNFPRFSALYSSTTPLDNSAIYSSFKFAEDVQILMTDLSHGVQWILAAQKLNVAKSLSQPNELFQLKTVLVLQNELFL